MIRVARTDLAALLALLCWLGTLPAAAVDGVIELSQVSALQGSVTAGDTPGFPIELYTGGSFRLTSDLVVPGTAEAAIFAYVYGTRIDLNGFTISSGTQCSGLPPVCAPTGTGIAIDSSGAEFVSVSNGRITGFGVYGLFFAAGSRAENLTIDNNGSAGIVGEEGIVVVDSIIRHNGGAGVTVAAGSRIAGNVIHQNGGPGIVAPSSVLAERNAVSENTGESFAGSPNRRFYLSANAALGSDARTACAAGFHMAALWEIFDPTNLTYDREHGFLGRGNANDDLGHGPPAGTPGWVRTGFNSILTPSGAGQVSCTGWTNGTISQNGSTAALNASWATPGAAWPWSLSAIQCNFPNGVWCVED